MSDKKTKKKAQIEKGMTDLGIYISTYYIGEILEYFVENEGMGEIIDKLLDIDDSAFVDYCKNHCELISSDDLPQACDDAGFIDPENYEPDQDESRN